MPLQTGFDALTTGTEVVGFLIAAAGHVMAVGVSGKKPTHSILLINAGLSGFFGLGMLIWLLEYSAFHVSISMALFAAGLVGFAWGPIGMVILAKKLGSVAGEKLGLDVPEIDVGLGLGPALLGDVPAAPPERSAAPEPWEVTFPKEPQP